MKYMLLIYNNEDEIQKASKETMTQRIAAYGAYTEALKTAGVLLGSNRLRPTATATTVHVANGKTNVLNGPYAETKEQLGGYFMIDAKNLDEAAAQFEACLAVNPAFVDAQYNLGVTLDLLGRADQARPHLAEATRLQPGFADAQEYLADLDMYPEEFLFAAASATRREIRAIRDQSRSGYERLTEAVAWPRGGSDLWCKGFLVPFSFSPSW